VKLSPEIAGTSLKISKIFFSLQGEEFVLIPAGSSTMDAAPLKARAVCCGGGGWFNFASNLRSSDRSAYTPENRNKSSGFHLAFPP
jgi:hypothetical protein